MNDLLGNPLDTLSDRELLEDIHRMLTELTAKKKPRVTGTPQRRHTYEPDFEKLWKAYPKRDGSNDKWKAQQCWRARIKESPDPKAEVDIMLAGVIRYRRWCDAKESIGTSYVMQATRFLGPGREYKSAWDIPAPQPKTIVIPRDLDEMVKFAAKHGIHPKPGESTYEFRNRIEDAIRE